MPLHLLVTPTTGVMDHGKQSTLCLLLLLFSTWIKGRSVLNTLHVLLPLNNHVQMGNDGFEVNCLGPVIVQDFLHQLHNTNDILTTQG